ncbi:hypothetical protein MMC07_007144 [Pseudocyphellaria aurata]|nr:hypothetical protein [Pseudocyphellaria aurata]
MVAIHLRLRSPVQLPRSIARILRAISVHLPPRNFITLHYAYFIGTCLVASVIFWGSSTPPRSISYTDSLFLTVSAMTLAGLNTVNLSELNTFQQFMLFALIMLGSAIFVSLTVVHVRRKAFERRFTRIVEDQRRQRRGRSRVKQRLAPAVPGPRSQTGLEADNIDVRDKVLDTATEQSHGESNGLQSSECRIHSLVSSDEHHNPPFNHTQEDNQITRAAGDEFVGLSRQITFAASISPTHKTRDSEGKQDISELDLFSAAGLVGRNSQFSSLTLAEREKLGGVEYQALTILAVIVPIYYVLWQLLGSLGLGAYIANNRASTTEANGLNPWWVGAFNAISAFNNSGMSLLDANMIAYIKLHDGHNGSSHFGWKHMLSNIFTAHNLDIL